jgi:N-acetylneuraminate epimerase
MPYTSFLRHVFRPTALILIILMNTQCKQGQQSPCQDQDLTWQTLNPIPDSTGFAGSFAGVADNALIVAGGANFPNGGAPWIKGSAKKWYSDVFVLESPKGQWKPAGHLPGPLGYGVSITTPDGLFIIGGSNEKGHEARAWRLHYREGGITTDSLPSLPFPLANACGALVDSTVYIAGGLLSPDSLNTTPMFLSLSLKAPAAGWQQLRTWPGPSRMLSVAGAANGKFYLFSGTQLVDGQRHYLQDAYAYTPGAGWQQLPSLPRSVVAAPSPAWHSPTGQLLLFGGDDGQLASANLQEKHPGFSDAVLQYNIDSARWQTAGRIFTRKEADAVAQPNHSVWAPVTTTFVEWEGMLVFPGGEVRPATRTPNVLAATPCQK